MAGNPVAKLVSVEIGSEKSEARHESLNMRNTTSFLLQLPISNLILLLPLKSLVSSSGTGNNRQEVMWRLPTGNVRT